MKLLRALLWLLLSMLAGALLWQVIASDPGLVIVRFRGYDISTSVPVAGLFLVLAGLAIWLLVSIIRIPFRVWSRYRQRRARARLSDGLLALHEGRWLRAQKLLEKAADESRVRLPALLAAATAARARGDDADAEHLLDLAANQPDRGAVALQRARLALAARQPAAALAQLDGVAVRPPPPAVHWLRAQALADSGRAADALPLLASVRRSRVLSDTAASAFEREMHVLALRQSADAGALDTLWRNLPGALRDEADVVASYARRAMNLGMEEQAAQAIEHALKRTWSDPLAALYGELPRPRSGSRLASAEAWLSAHSSSPDLLLALSRICRSEERWIEAEEYAHRAIAQGAGSEAWESLGQCFASQSDDKRARQAFANALAVRGGKRAVALTGRSLRQQIQDEAVPEDRNAHGMPRLRS
ncbi:MAG: porphyrin biosynthesis protein [Lysobacterales bacterium CG17_big_fil_post_rev_8_21_14_2_50_64_11]|nr:MAG: porphyrin biosynthesis protein [Xanthomonadales bacterium CG17_big_fil_post_rev_8_21_14_2_50_64_11]PIX60712.1 MAG: porphyrin biosynthesis protein [Xanthomonadales bacterium CG_4_10_14_3_um_filter_64_11]